MLSPAVGSGASRVPTTLTRDSQRRSLVSPQTSLGYTQMQIFLRLLTSTLPAENARNLHDSMNDRMKGLFTLLYCDLIASLSAIFRCTLTILRRLTRMLGTITHSRSLRTKSRLAWTTLFFFFISHIQLSNKRVPID
jgi:hypothetical protein